MRYRFDSFELDEDTFELTRNGQPVTVQRLVLETIAFLIRHHHQVVSKDQLIAGPWGGTLVSDATVNHTIMLARRALSDDASSPRLIKTIRGKGFRFVGDLERPQPIPPKPPPPSLLVSSKRRSDLPNLSFLGRSQQLESMRDAARNALTGRGSLLLIGGELGSGKTTLLERFAASGGEADVFWGRCWEGGGAPAFWPWLEVIRGYVAQYGAEWARESMGAGVSDIANQLPDLRQRLVQSGPRHAADSTTAPKHASGCSDPSVSFSRTRPLDVRSSWFSTTCTVLMTPRCASSSFSLASWQARRFCSSSPIGIGIFLVDHSWPLSWGLRSPTASTSRCLA